MEAGRRPGGTEIPQLPPLQPELEQLEWMVGQWIDQSEDATIETNVAWTKNKSFLTCHFKVAAAGGPPSWKGRK